MDLILNIFKHISQVVSPTEALMIICLIAAIVVVILKFTYGALSKKGAFGGLMGGDDEAIKREKMHQAISEKFASLLSKDEYTMGLANVKEELLDAVHSLSREQMQRLSDIVSKVEILVTIKREVETSISSIQEDIRAIRHQIQMHDVNDEKSFNSIKDSLQRVQDAVNRIMNQVEKADEYAKTVVPEFRGHHKDLNSALAEISKDIALVERSIQTQIVSSAGVTLR